MPTPINRKVFFATVRLSLFNGTLTQAQVDGINAVLDYWEKTGLTDLRWLAYMLATDYHETNATMQAVREAYWLSEDWRRVHLRYYPYYGRGLVQLTWPENYAKMERFLGIPLTSNPDLALDLPTAVIIMFEGMMNAETGVGDFTGRSLEMFFNDKKDDPIGARTIINGTDKDMLIADYHKDFLHALQDATVDVAPGCPVPPGWDPARVA